jgi:replicative DNA helicase
MAKVNPELLDRLPPSDQAAEKALLGSILIDPRRIDEVSTMISATDFYTDAHQKIFAAMLDLHDRRQAIDVNLLAARMTALGSFEAAGGAEYLLELTRAVGAAVYAAHYASLVKEKAVLRSLIHAATDILRDAWDPGAESAELLLSAEAKLGQVRTSEDRKEPVPLSQVALEATKEFEQIHLRHSGMGAATGLADFDETIGGLPRGLTVLAGRTSEGKTALAMQIAQHNAERSRPVYYVSLEMSRTTLFSRLACGGAEVDGAKLMTGKLDTQDMAALAAESNRLAGMPLYVNDSPETTVLDVRRTARRLNRKHRLSLVVVDYLGQVKPADSRVPREQQVAEMSRQFKILSGELKVPVLMLAQFNRQVAPGEPPELRFLRESGSVEQDADMVLAVWTNAAWPHPEGGKPVVAPEQAALAVLKNRNGKRTTLKLRWVAERVRFQNVNDPF